MVRYSAMGISNRKGIPIASTYRALRELEETEYIKEHESKGMVLSNGKRLGVFILTVDGRDYADLLHDTIKRSNEINRKKI